MCVCVCVCVQVVSPLLSIPRGVDVVLVPSQHLVLLPDQAIISSFVHGGGCCLWHGVDTSSFSATAWDMMGAAAADFRSPRPSSFQVFERNWTVSAFLGAGKTHVQLGTRQPLEPRWGQANTLAEDDRGIGALYRSHWGSGTSVTATAAIDAGLDTQDLGVWYRGVLSLCSGGGGGGGGGGGVHDF